MTVTFLNDRFVAADEASLHVSDLSIQRGYGIFDFFRVINNRILFFDDYVDRFYASAEAMELPVPMERDAFRATVAELMHKNKLPDSGIKVILTGGYSPDAYHISKPNLVIIQQPLVLPAIDSKGVKVISHEYVRDMPHIKSINYLVGIWLLKKMEQQKAFDVLYHKNREVSEFPRCNFFIVRKDGTIMTPAKNILHGITRKHVIQLARKKYEVVEGSVTWEDIHLASEAFLTSTTKRIVPVVKIDEHVIGNGAPGSITNELLQDLLTLEQSELKKS